VIFDQQRVSPLERAATNLVECGLDPLQGDPEIVTGSVDFVGVFSSSSLAEVLLSVMGCFDAV